MIKDFLVKKRVKGDYEDEWQGWKFHSSHKTEEEQQKAVEKLTNQWPCCEFRGAKRV